MSPSPVRLLWDRGGLWSLFTYQACRDLGLALRPISAADLAAGGLAHARLLVVPGGWSPLKLQALGPAGAAAIRDFVAAGGTYLGLCGGAGLALSVEHGLGLVNLGRAAEGQRLPGLSGPVLAVPEPASADHPLWQGQARPGLFHVWWPGQFAEPASPDIEVLARYQRPAPGLCIADLQVDQIEPAAWPQLEAAYGMALDPACVWGQPAVIQARLGRGRLLLSYLHLDTPGCPAGAQAMRSLWQHWLGDEAAAATAPQAGPPHPGLADLAGQAQALWNLGQDLGLWQPRHPAMPLWQRGARGLEFWTLLRLCRAAAQAAEAPEADEITEGLERVLAPVFEHGPAVLRAQAARLAGQEPEPTADQIEAAWFPRPRRTGGELAEALRTLEDGLLALLNQGGQD
ncbi:MAG: BPL-N domain-containing protein [Thermodesulfobacteriota bacterium]